MSAPRRGLDLERESRAGQTADVDKGDALEALIIEPLPSDFLDDELGDVALHAHRLPAGTRRDAPGEFGGRALPWSAVPNAGPRFFQPVFDEAEEFADMADFCTWLGRRDNGESARIVLESLRSPSKGDLKMLSIQALACSVCNYNIELTCFIVHV